MSAYQNTIVLKGYLGKDAEGRTNSNQTPFTVLSLDTKSSHKDKSGAFVSRTDWHRVVLFGRLANSATELVRGDYIEVQGELRSYRIPSQGASARRFWEVRAYSVERPRRLRKTIFSNFETFLVNRFHPNNRPKRVFQQPRTSSPTGTDCDEYGGPCHYVPGTGVAHKQEGERQQNQRKLLISTTSRVDALRV